MKAYALDFEATGARIVGIFSQINALHIGDALRIGRDDAHTDFAMHAMRTQDFADL